MRNFLNLLLLPTIPFHITFHFNTSFEGKVVTFPDSQLLHHTFANSSRLVNLATANSVVYQAFAKADDQWRNALANVSIADIIHDSLHGEKLTFVNWNDL